MIVKILEENGDFSILGDVNAVESNLNKDDIILYNKDTGNKLIVNRNDLVYLKIYSDTMQHISEI